MFIFFVIVIALLIYLSFKWFRGLWELQQLKIPNHSFTPYPMVIDIIYAIIEFAISSPEERFTVMAELSDQYPDMMKFWFGPKLVVFANHPQRIQKVLLSQKCADKWEMFYGFMNRENGLISARTSLKWKEHRKFFNLPTIESFVPMFAECSDDLCETLKKQTEGKLFDFLPIVKKFSFNLLCLTCSDMKAKDVFDETICEKIYDGFETTEEALNYKIEIPFLYPNTIFKLTNLRREEKKAQQVLEDFRHNIMKKRRSVMTTNESLKNNSESKNNGRTVLIDHIIRNEEKFSSKEIFDHVITFMGGYETMSNAVAHVLLLLAINPEKQQNLYAEIEQTIISDDDIRNSSLINGMEYLEFALRESYRLMPTVPMILREVTDDFEIEPNLVIPKGVHIVINFYALHRRKDIWGPDSNEFKPERFASEKADNRHLFSYLPFSGGTRICIANKYSNLAMKIIFVKLLRQFKFTSPMKMQDIRLKSYISLKLCTEHLISLERR